MKQLTLMLSLIFCISLNAQNKFTEEFCPALKALTKQVKKKKIKHVAYNDTTYAMSGKLRGVEKSMATNYKFFNNQPLFQTNFGNPMSGKKSLINEFQAIYGAGYIKLDNEQLQSALVGLLKDGVNTITDCDCKKISGNPIPDKLEKDSYETILWDCGKNGKVSLIYSTFELSDGVADFKSYLNFDYSDL